MHSAFATLPAESAIPITLATKAAWKSISHTLGDSARRFAEASGFAGKSGQYLALPNSGGEISHVLFGLGDEMGRSSNPFQAGKLPELLPAGTYRFANTPH
ncbi:MAG: leucyl aminopeptidase family protein, partial [Proteobacteria bacterium]|nr:leucyl aminopeptidase family protein [Pseudomonadota bacterium]